MTARDNSASTMNFKEWRKRQQELRQAKQAQEVPAEQSPQQAENTAIAKLLSTLPQDKRNTILDEYDSKGGNDLAWLRESVQSAKSVDATAPAPQQIDEAALWQEYNERRSKLVATGQRSYIPMLKKEMRSKGLRSIN